MTATKVADLGRTLQQVRSAHGCAVVLIEHDVRFVMNQCARVVVLQRGRVLADGSPDEIRADGAVRRAYLG